MLNFATKKRDYSTVRPTSGGGPGKHQTVHTSKYFTTDRLNFTYTKSNITTSV